MMRWANMNRSAGAVKSGLIRMHIGLKLLPSCGMVSDVDIIIISR
jgi:hypothetical protein